ncbi:MAG: hypothetical protein KBA55_11220 [Ruminococcus sp.]|nr:hypothetical protein [Ruminococcus sp.]
MIKSFDKIAERSGSGSFVIGKCYKNAGAGLFLKKICQKRISLNVKLYIKKKINAAAFTALEAAVNIKTMF